MDTYKLSWSYSLSADAVFRLPILEGGTSFRHITKQIVRGLSVLCCHRSEIEGTGFVRPVYTVFVGNELFDLIFNSTYGYRAAYFRSPGAGLDANDLFMRAIASRLEEDSLSPNSGLAQAFLHESLITPSAKVWLVEHGKEIDSRCFGCKGEWGSASAGPPGQAEILNGRWETSRGHKAEWGRKAPFLTKLRVMGAFINERHDERVSYDKRFRASEIHQYGWS